MGFATSANHSKLASSTSFIIFPKLQSEYVYDKVMNKIYLSIVLPVQPLARLELEWSVVLEVMPYIINQIDMTLRQYAFIRLHVQDIQKTPPQKQQKITSIVNHILVSSKFCAFGCSMTDFAGGTWNRMRRAVPGVFHCFSKRHSRLCSSHPCAAWNMLSCPGKLSEISSTLQTCSSGQELQGQ